MNFEDLQDIYIFHVRSFFHLTIVESYIEKEQIDKAIVFFIISRGVKLPNIYKSKILYDDSVHNLVGRIKLYLKNKEKFKNIFFNRRVHFFSPFQLLFPFRTYYYENSFFEEGFSAYTIPHISSSIKSILIDCAKSLTIDVFFAFSSRNIKGFLMGASCSLSKPLRQTRMLVVSIDAYAKYDFGQNLRKILVTVMNNDYYQARVANKVIIVMDRLSRAGRPFNEIIYLETLSKVVSQMARGDLLIKLHPADYNFKLEAEHLIRNELEKTGTVPVFIEDNLERIALYDANNIFIGTSSTILYYAPILGKTNKAISFARQLAYSDEIYAQFLERWGGVDRFCELFSAQVECL